MKIRKLLAGVLIMSAAVSMTSCLGGAGGEITVVSREDGSGTRGAFIELFGIQETNEAGEKVDMTTADSQINNNTAVMMATIAGNENAIGYISLGSLNDTVKAVKIDGAQATTDNVKNGTYKIARPFVIVTKDSVSEAAQDFINFILSKEGQDVVSADYIGDENAAAFAGTNPEGKIVVAGSSSVTPVMEKLKEAYLALNANVSIEIQMSDSTTGVTSAIEGICDIGMASREIKDTEIEQGLIPTVIATDGIAVIVHNDNEKDGLTAEQVKSVYTGEITSWDDLDS